MKKFTHHFSHLFVLAVLLLSLLPSAQAEILDGVQVAISRPDGASKEGLEIFLKDPINGAVIKRVTNSAGTVQFPFIEEGTYELKIDTNRSQDFLKNGMFQSSTEEVIVDKDLALEVMPGFFVQQFSRTLIQFPRALEVQFFIAPNLNFPDQGDPTRPIEDALVLVEPEDSPPGSEVITKTDANGIAYIGVTADTMGAFGARIAGRGAVAKYVEGTIPPGAGDHRVTFATLEADAVFEVQLVDGETGADFTLNDPHEADISCDGFSANQSFHFESVPGAARLGGLIFVPVVSGLEWYRCHGGFQNGSHAVEELIVGDPITPETIESLEARVFDVDGTLTVRFVDVESGVPVNDIKAKVDLFSEAPLGDGQPISFQAHKLFPIGETSISMSVVSGHYYKPQIRIEYSDEDTSRYMLASRPEPIGIAGDLNIDIPVQRTDATITVSLTGTEGQIVENGWASISTFIADDNGNESEIHQQVDLGEDGSTMFPVLAGVTYEVRSGVHPDGETGLEDILLPAPRFVTVTENQTLALEFSLGLPNYLLSISPTIVGDGGTAMNIAEATFVRCGAINEEGERSGSDTLYPDGTVEVFTRVNDLQRSETLSFACHAVFESEEDGGGNGTQYFGRSSIQTKKGEEDRDVSLELSSLGTFYETKQEEFSPDESKTITFPDGRLRFRSGAGAFGEGSQVVLQYGSASGYGVSENLVPIVVYDITPSLDDETIEVPDQNVELCYEVTTEQLAEYGVTIDSLMIARYENDWVPATTTVSSDQTEICGEVDHFSNWGVLVDVAQSLKEITPDLSLRKIRKGWATLNWSVDSDNVDGTEQYLVEYSKKVKKKKQCESMESFPKSKIVSGSSWRLRMSKGKKQKSTSSRNKTGGLCARVSYYSNGSTNYSTNSFRKSRK